MGTLFGSSVAKTRVHIRRDVSPCSFATPLQCAANRSASTKIYVGELTAGPGKLTEKFKAPASAGNYFFRCDAHPDQMTGTFVVK